jgi:hypothetical protein
MSDTDEALVRFKVQRGVGQARAGKGSGGEVGRKHHDFGGGDGWEMLTKAEGRMAACG